MRKSPQQSKWATIFALITLFAALAATLCAPGSAQARGKGSGLILIRDAETEKLLLDMIEPILKLDGYTRSSLKLYVVADDSINGFVTEGWRLVLHTGLLMDSPGASALMGVLAHEIGHLRGGHIVQTKLFLKKLQAANILVSLLSLSSAVLTGRPEGAIAAATGFQSSSQRIALRFNREFESGADRYALRALDQLDLSAEGFLHFMEGLKKKEPVIPEALTPYILTHPLTTTRIRSIRRHIDQSSTKGEVRSEIQERFARMQSKLRGYFRPRSFAKARNKNDVAAHYGLAIAQFRSGDFDGARQLIDELIELEPDNPYFHETRAEITFHAGNREQARNSIRRAIELAPSEVLIALSGAHILNETTDGTKNDYREILRLSRFVKNAEPKNPTAWQLISIAQARLGRRGRAMLANAERLLVLGKIPEARRIAAQAVEHLAKDPVGQRRASEIAAPQPGGRTVTRERN